MAELSDQLLVVTVLGYLAAMICHAAEYALGTRSVVDASSRAGAVRPVRELVGVGVTAGYDRQRPPVSKGADPLPTGPVAPGDGGLGPLLASRLKELGPGSAGRLAVAATVLAALAHLGVLVTRGIAADRMPWGNMYEYCLTVAFAGVVTWLVVLSRRPALRQLGLFVSVAMVLLLGLAGVVLYTPIAPLVPALNSYWFVIHVSAMVLSSGILLLGAVPAVMYLLRSGYEQGKRSFPYPLGRRGPGPAALERLTFGLHAFAFPIFTFGVIAGAIWAEGAWGRAWGWDPKEVWAFISWVVYAGYLHARATPSIKRSVVAWIAVVGFLTMLMNLVGVNFFFTGLHSYAGLD